MSRSKLYRFIAIGVIFAAILLFHEKPHYERIEQESPSSFPKSFGANGESRDFYQERNLPFDEEHFLRIARLYSCLGLGKSALRNAFIAADICPEDPKVHLFIGELLLSRGKAELAIEGFKKAYALDQSSHQALMGMGQALVSVDRVGEGLSKMLRALRLKGNSPEYLLSIAKVYESFGNGKDAMLYRKRANQERKAPNLPQ